METIEIAETVWRRKVTAQRAWRPISADTGQPHDAQLKAPLFINLVPAFPIDAKGIEPRNWAIPGLWLHRYLSVLVAPPGSGKSLLTLQLAIAKAAGINWGGWTMRKRGCVLIINAEDDLTEMHRRLFAAAEAMGIGQDQLGGLLLAEAPETIVIAQTDGRTKTVIRTPLFEPLIQTIIDNKIDVVVIDPFAETFEGDENSNSEVKWAGIAWREVARRTGAAVMLVHHTRKYANAMAGDADASRGGGALIGTARIVATLFAMTENEAAIMEVSPDRRASYVRFDDAKANLSLVTGVAKWFEKQTVTLPNNTAFLPGDDVGVLVPWKPPGLMDGFSDDRINDVLDVIARGILTDEGVTTGDRFTASATSKNKERWVITPICRLLECDEDKARLIAGAWLKSGLLVVEDYQNRNADTRKGLRVDHEKRPGKERS